MSVLKGKFGELKTALKLTFSLNRRVYTKFHNVIIPTNNGTSQIDHVIVSAFGIFIVETKNMSGWIFGSEDRAVWTQVIYGKKFRHQNPLRQTYRQKKSLMEFLQVNESCIYTIINYNGNCVFKSPFPSNVINYGLTEHIKGYSNKVLSQNEIDKIIKKLKQHMATHSLTSKDHIRSLHERHNSKSKCPKCGSELVLRTVSKGPDAGKQFLGCDSFPGCRFSRSA